MKFIPESYIRWRPCSLNLLDLSESFITSFRKSLHSIFVSHGKLRTHSNHNITGEYVIKFFFFLIVIAQSDGFSTYDFFPGGKVAGIFAAVQR